MNDHFLNLLKLNLYENFFFKNFLYQKGNYIKRSLRFYDSFQFIDVIKLIVKFLKLLLRILNKKCKRQQNADSQQESINLVLSIND